MHYLFLRDFTDLRSGDKIVGDGGGALTISPFLYHQVRF